MASIILRSNEVVHAFVLLCLLVLMHKGDAYEFVVGGQKGWSVPSDPNGNPYNQWAEKSRFQVGDSLGELSYILFHCFYQRQGKNGTFLTSFKTISFT